MSEEQRKLTPYNERGDMTLRKLAMDFAKAILNDSSLVMGGEFDEWAATHHHDVNVYRMDPDDPFSVSVYAVIDGQTQTGTTLYAADLRWESENG